MALIGTVIGRGLAAAKPATHYEGWLYYETDNGKWVRSNGTTWDDCEPDTTDAGDITYTPTTATDWDGDADPGDLDDALDQLAERVDDNEIAIAGKADGPGSATDNAIARYDGTGGKTLQDSGVTIDDDGNMSLGGDELRNFSEQIVAANTGSSYEIDWAAATLFELTLTDSPTFTFANLGAGRSITLILIQDGTGSREVTWPASVDWPSATAPTLSTGAGDVDVITLFVRNDGTTVLGFEAGLDMG